MDREKKKILFFGGILGLIILISILYFLWGSFINRGTILIHSDPPFTVEFFGGETYECETSPCEIKQKIGTKSVILSKEGYKTIVKEIKIGLWQTTEIDIDFEIIPYLVEIENLPDLEEEKKYSIVFDEIQKMYKLVNAEDMQKRAIVYFQKEIIQPQVFGSENKVLLISQNSDPLTAYVIDIIKKTREKITDPNLRNITEGSWSRSGKYFVFSKEKSEFLWILESKNSIKKLDLKTNETAYAWTYDGDLHFITHQGTEPRAQMGKYGNNYINIFTSVSDYGFTIGEYHPDENSYTKIEVFSEISEVPDSLIPASNGQIIYFQSGENKYKIILK
ncbi:PEGA domain-containing protein [Candidatus Peregrinibacteria bacterium]|nr:PEGA domain-containing protein [Candidatus Peregrinibacteria bacterium]